MNGASTKSRQETLKDDLGFESESDNSSNEDDEQQSPFSQDDDDDNDRDVDGDGDDNDASHSKHQSNVHPSSSSKKQHSKKKPKKKMTSDSENDDNDELERLAEALQVANEAKMKAENEKNRLEERLEELKAVSHRTTLIVKEKLSAKIKSLMMQVEEQRAQMEEDEENMSALREKITLMESGGDVSQATIKIREFKDSRTLGRENISLRYRVEELTQQNRLLRDEHEDTKKQLVDATTKLQKHTQDGNDVDCLKDKMSSLESDRLKLRDELKKRFIERSKLLAKVRKLQQSLGLAEDTNPLDDIDDGDDTHDHDHIHNNNNNNNQHHHQNNDVNRSSASQEVIEKLQAEIKQLKEALKNATRPMVQLASTTTPSTSTTTPPTTTSPTTTTPPTTTTTTPPPPSSTTSPTAAATSTSAEVIQLRADKSSLEEMLRKADTLMKRREEEMNLVKNKAKEKLTTASGAITKLKEEYNKLRDQYNRVKHSSVGVESELRTRLTQSIHKRKRVMTSMRATITMLKSELIDIRTQVSNGLTGSLSSMGPILLEAFTKLNDKNSSQIDDLRDKYMKEMKLRKTLFNQIQELKGNIRVYCRVRPMNERERASEGDECITFPSNDELTIVNPEKKTSHVFEFEKIFRPMGTTQETVFAEISELVTSCLDGYNVCIFAYGQTGSGKTYTMQGPAENPGVNVRALAMLFSEAEQRKPDIKYEINMSLLEIYNEQIKDLLTTSDTSNKQQLKCVQGKDGQEVPGLTMVSVSSKEEVLDTLKLGSKNRHVSATNMNDVSSRSHLILSVYVIAYNTLTKKETRAKLHLIDLAGSERVGRSGVVGDALKEAQNINQSLSALGNCIHARANKADHVPYRDSTLTWLLKDSLEKNSKTLMFVQISPMLKDASESVCSLKFAARVREVELGKATKNEKKSKD